MLLGGGWSVSSSGVGVPLRASETTGGQGAVPPVPGWLEDSSVIKVFCCLSALSPETCSEGNKLSLENHLSNLWTVLACRLLLSSGVFGDLTADPSSRAEVLKQHALPRPLSTALACWFLVLCSGF